VTNAVPSVNEMQYLIGTYSSASGISIGEISTFIGIFVFVVAITGGVVTYILRRRETTGTTRTSEATVLWDQAQKMRAELTSQIERLTEQRDRLIELQTSQTVPVLHMIIDALKEITDSLARIDGKLNGKK